MGESQSNIISQAFHQDQLIQDAGQKNENDDYSIEIVYTRANPMSGTGRAKRERVRKAMCTGSDRDGR